MRDLKPRLSLRTLLLLLIAVGGSLGLASGSRAGAVPPQPCLSDGDPLGHPPAALHRRPVAHCNAVTPTASPASNAPAAVADDVPGYILTMDSTFQWIDYSESPPFTAEMSATAQVALPFDDSYPHTGHDIAGQDVITLGHFSLANGALQCTKSGPLGTLEASAEVYDDAISNVRMWISAGCYVSCPMIGNVYNLWFTALYGMHENEMVGQGWRDGVLVDGWWPVYQGDLIQRKTYNRSRYVEDDLEIIERTTFELWRMPPLPEVSEIQARGFHTPGEKPETGREVTVWAEVAESSDYDVSSCFWSGDLDPGHGDIHDNCRRTYTPIPDHGPAQDTYGDKDVSLSLTFTHKDSGARMRKEVTGEYQVYFAKHGLDHGHEGDPNWFAYWGDDGAVPGLDVSDVFYDPSLDGYGRYTNGDILIGPYASEVHYEETIEVPASAICPGGTFGGARGIDAVTEVLAHERRHESIYDQWHHIGTNTCSDAEGWWGDCPDGDGDELPNAYEGVFGTSPLLADSCNLAGIRDKPSYASYGDQELDAMLTGDGQLGVSANDWANPGMQSSPLNPVATTLEWPWQTSGRTAEGERAGARLAASALDDLAALTGSYGHEAVDTDADGLYEGLNMTTGVSVTVASRYNLVAWLEDSSHHEVAWAAQAATLATGTHTVTLFFDGPAVRRSGLDGPYHVARVELQTGEHVRVVDSADQVVTTPAHAHTDFEPPAAALRGTLCDVTQPLPGEPGMLGDLEFAVGFENHEPGRYVLQGTLSAGMQRVGLSSRTLEVPSGTHTTTLTFPREAIFDYRADGPYALRDLRLLSDTGELLDFAAHPYTTTAAYAYRQFRYGDTWVDPAGFTDAAVDQDGDEVFDRLDVTVPITVTEIGSYRVAALLEDSTGGLIDSDWALLAAAPEVITATQQMVATIMTATLGFDGQAIAQHGVDGPYQVSGLSILRHDGARADGLPLAHTTAAYACADFGVARTERVCLPLISKWRCE